MLLSFSSFSLSPFSELTRNNAVNITRSRTEAINNSCLTLTGVTPSYMRRPFPFCLSLKFKPMSPPQSHLSLGIPGDGRCLFRSVVHGACLRSGKPSPSETQEKELADGLRATVADEFIKRRADTEWYIEGDFDTYVAQMRQPHVWGGEPELLMSAHVLQAPISVYMWDKKKKCLKTIAEYGQVEYGKENPIRVLYHGYGHYDALQLQNPSAADASPPQSQLQQSKRW